ALDQRRVCFSVLFPDEAVSIPRLELRRRFCGVRGAKGQELLSRADLSGVPCGGSGGDREAFRANAASLAETGERGAANCRRRLVCTRSRSHSFRGAAGFLPGQAPIQSAAERAQPYARGAPATLRRSIWLGGDGRGREPGVPA